MQIFVNLNIESLLLQIEDHYCAGMDMYQERMAKKLLCVQYQLVEGLKAVPKLDGKITMKMLVGHALASHQSISPLLQKIKVLFKIRKK